MIESLEGRALMTAGALDTTYGGTGMVTTAIGTFASESLAAAVQPDLKVVVAGWTNSPSQFAIARCNPDGSLDTAFGSGGIVVLPLSQGNGAQAVALQPDGKILAAGSAEFTVKKGTSIVEWAVVRLNPNGSLDTTFGGGTGEVFTAFAAASSNPPSAIVYALALQSDGKIVATGTGSVTQNGTVTNGLAVARYNPDGSLDTAFGSGGKVVDTALGPLSWNGRSGQMVAIDGSGRIDVAGRTGGATSGMDVARFQSNGALDSSFGSGGMVSLLPPGATYAMASSLGLQSTGQIVVYGASTFPPGTVATGTASVATLLRLNPDGSLDTSFGSRGIYTDNRMYQASGMVIQPADDKIVAVAIGDVNGSLSPHFWVTRVLANGSAYDPTFGTNGLAEANFNSGTSFGERPSTAALAPDGKIVVTGMLTNGTRWVFGTARFLGDPLSTTTTLTTSLNPSTSGQSVTFTATVTASCDIPTGTVSFYDGSTPLGSGTLSTANGVTTASFTTAALAVGTHSITATYSGDSNDLSSTSAALTQTVNSTATATMAATAASSSTLAASSYRPTQGVALSSTGPILAPLVLDDPIFPTGPVGGRRRHLS
jgi:uncharacterized delta-60 repeat protein